MMSTTEEKRRRSDYSDRKDERDYEAAPTPQTRIDEAEAEEEVIGLPSESKFRYLSRKLWMFSIESRG